MTGPPRDGFLSGLSRVTAQVGSSPQMQTPQEMAFTTTLLIMQHEDFDHTQAMAKGNFKQCFQGIVAALFQGSTTKHPGRVLYCRSTMLQQHSFRIAKAD